METDPYLYVPREEVQIAMSYGAVYTVGEARLKVPSPLPEGVSPGVFTRWRQPEMKIVWLSEFLEDLCRAPVDLMNVAGLIEAIEGNKAIAETEGVALYVPKFEMDKVRLIPGVKWDRKSRRYIATQRANFELIYPYLTTAMRAAWITENNLDIEVEMLMKSRALKYQIKGTDGGNRDEKEIQREQLPDMRRPGNTEGFHDESPF